MAGDILLGLVVDAQGLRGEVRVKTFTATPERLGAYGPLHASDGRKFEIADVRPLKGDLACVRFRGIDGRTAAEALKGTELYIAREALPAPQENEFYHADLIGLRAEDAEGRLIGAVRAIHNFGAGDVIEIARSEGGSLLLPFTRETVPDIDVAAKRVVVFEQADPSAMEQRGIE